MSDSEIGKLYSKYVKRLFKSKDKKPITESKTFESLYDLVKDVETLREDYLLTAEPLSGGATENLGIVDDASFKEIKKDVDTYKYKVFTVIDELLRDKNWYKSGARQKEIKSLTVISFRDSGIPSSFLAGLNIRLQNNGLNYLEEAISSKPSFNIITTMLEGLLPLAPENSSEIVSFIKSLWIVQPKINNVNTGAGEMAMSFLSNGKKGTKGDLAFPKIGEVEVKGIAGRFGPSTTALNAKNRLSEILAKKYATNKNKEIKAEIKNISTVSFADAWKLFFNDKWRLSRSETIEGILACNNYEYKGNSEKKAIYNQLNTLLPQDIKFDNVFFKELSYLVGALQLTLYAENSDFNYIMLINNSFNAYCIKINKGTGLYSSIYHKIRVPNVSIGMSFGDVNKTVSILLK